MTVALSATAVLGVVFPSTHAVQRFHEPTSKGLVGRAYPCSLPFRRQSRSVRTQTLPSHLLERGPGMKKLLISTLIAVAVAVPQQAKASEACSNIVHIGDSLTVHSRKFQKHEYKLIGYPKAVISAGGSRSMYNKTPKDDFTGIEAVKHWKKRLDSNTCWVIALGTNDSPSWKYEDVGGRVTAVMRELKGMKVAWVTVWKGKTNNPSARNWNAMLVKKAKQHKNLYIINWHNVVAKNKKILNGDFVHYGGTGSQMRAKYIARMVNTYWLN